MHGVHPHKRECLGACGLTGSVCTGQAPSSLRHSLITQHVNGFIAFRPIPGMPRGGVLPPTPVLAPGAALGSRPRVALSSAQVTLVYPAALGSDNFLLLGVGASPGRGRRRLLSAPGPAVVRVQPT